MNKKYFLNELEKETKLTKEECLVISDVLDDYFVFGKKNKEKIVNGFKENLNINEEKADELYNTVMNIIKDSIKTKIKHPFKSKD